MLIAHADEKKIKCQGLKHLGTGSVFVGPPKGAMLSSHEKLWYSLRSCWGIHLRLFETPRKLGPGTLSSPRPC